MGGPLRRCNRPVPDSGHQPRTGPVDFALAPALRVRLLGTGLVAIGLVVALGVLVTWSPTCPRRSSPASSCSPRSAWCRSACWSAYATGCCASTTTGYRVRVLRTAEARSARWTDVLDLQAGTVSGHPVPGAAPARRAYDGPAGRRDRGWRHRPDRGPDHPPRPGTRLPPTALTADPAHRIFRRPRRMGNLWPAVLEVSPSPVYGARLLSGLRVIPSRGFKSRHLRG